MHQPDPLAHLDVFTRRQALAAGLSRHQMEWALRSGRWLTLRRATYCRRETYEAASTTQRHLLHSRAALAAHDDRHVLSHLSAALSFGLPGPLGDLGPATLTIGGRPASTDRQADLVVQVAGLRDRDVHRTSSWRRTTPARTVADCLRHLSAPDAVAIADAAVHRGLTTVRQIDEVLAWQAGWPYQLRGTESLRLVDARRESWLESFSFVTLYGVGIELPISQVDILDADGFIGRCDGLWSTSGTVAEADGRRKYDLAGWVDLASVEPGMLDEARREGARRALVAEKVREDRLRGAGLEVVRFGTYDVEHRLPELVRDVRAAFARADPRRFRGVARLDGRRLAVGSG